MTKPAQRSRLAANCDGATAVEFAFLVGLLALMALGIIDFGRAFWQHMEVQNAAQAGADYVQNHPYDLASVRSEAENATGLALTDSDVSATASTGGATCGCPSATGVTMGQTCGAVCTGGYGPANGYVTVTVTANFTPLFPWPGVTNPTPLTGTATSMCGGGATC